MIDYKNTLNLPQTDFSMKADLAKREPAMLVFWQKIQLYRQMQALGVQRPKYIVHDGPPYANGHIHIGHALNKILKDITVKAKTLSGFVAPFVPGWDCHGLPIELNVEKQLGKADHKVSANEFRQACRQYAQSQVAIQSEEFQRLGIQGDWQRPYLTMDFHYEADIIRSLAKMVANGHLQRGSKPVHWCVDCGSALAEAEVEYQDKTSLAIDVRFRLVDETAFWAKLPVAANVGEGPISIPVWTTTPWTLPANAAVALKKMLPVKKVETGSAAHSYVLVQVRRDGKSERLLLAAALYQSCLQRYGFEPQHYSVLTEIDLTKFDWQAGQIEQALLLQHPLYPERKVPVIFGEHVEMVTGTGAVHTAPAHGEDDYLVGQQYGLALVNPVDNKGCFKTDTPLLGGTHVFKAQETILTALQANASLLKAEKFPHSYPHCWRHKTPLIFLATPQWFISMDRQHLRATALAAVKQVAWLPSWGENRITDMVAQRPDWCISRQRTWGTPLPLFIHTQTGELHPDTLDLMEKVAELVEQSGVEAWYALAPATLLGDVAADYQKVSDTLDVWFDAGVSHAAVLAKRAELQLPADLYLEGSDQYRGWFQSALLTSVAMQDVAPYRAIITHGFTVDGQGRKMSKSLGNVIAPEKIWNTLGADVLRLWVATTDYRGEITVSDEILKRASETYRRIRNTARYLLSNLFDFMPTQIVPFAQMVALDRWAVAHTQRLNQEIEQAYQQFQFHVVTQKIQHFCSIDMGSFYLDVIKDRQYTGATGGHARRSAQTAMYYILEALVRWLAPILSFTAEEVWQAMPWKTDESVFLTTWRDDLPSLAKDESLGFAFWQQLMQVRDEVNRALEKARANNLIGAALEAKITLYAGAELYHTLTQIGDELRFVLITSYAQVLPAEQRDEQAVATQLADLWLQVAAADFAKCSRCWHRRQEVGSNAQHPQICDRCVVNISGVGENRLYA